MKLTVSTSGDFKKTTKWLEDITISKVAPTVNKMAREGVKALQNATPRDTGETANGWQSEVITRKNEVEVYFYNNAHPESEVNVAKLIQIGHATSNGGYVAPINYIRPAINSVFGSRGNKLVEEMFK